MPNWIQQSWSRPKTIALATDLNDLDYLLPQSRAQAKATGAALWLVRVIPPEAYGSPKSGAYPLVDQEMAFRNANEALGRVAHESERLGIACHYEVRRWFAAQEIKNFVEERGIERLIIGISGKGTITCS